MKKDLPYYNELLERYLQNNCTPQEAEEILDYLQKNESTRLLLRKMNEAFKSGDTKSPSILGEYSDRVREQLIKKTSTAKVVPMRISWSRVAVAAAIVLILLTGGYFILNNLSSHKKNLVKENDTHEQLFKNDVAPGGNKAVLMLADGSKIILDSASDGTLTQQGNTKVLKLNNGQLAYNFSSGGLASGEIFYNTISTPRGGQYQVILPDGSKVWLNAASSLRFPTAFTGKERRVEITGEAYFEVMPLDSKGGSGKTPFIVSILPRGSQGVGSEVEVLGTHFNVMAYDDENAIKTTLLEGAVKVRKGNSIGLLKPGQQAQLDNSGAVKIVNDIDVDQAVAWKNGVFDFNDDVILDIMRQLSRWYDVEIFYSGNIPDGHYVGSIRRQANVSEVLKMLEAAGGIQFSIDGKKIVVKEK